MLLNLPGSNFIVCTPAGQTAGLVWSGLAQTQTLLMPHALVRNVHEAHLLLVNLDRASFDWRLAGRESSGVE